MPRFAKEIPVAGRDWLLEHPSVPETELQALMEAEPNQTLALSKDVMGAAEDAVVASLDLSALSEEELAVVEVTVFAGHSVRNAARILGWHKSTVHRLKQSALAVLRQRMENDEEV